MKKLTIAKIEYYRDTHDEFKKICNELIEYKSLGEILGIDLIVLFKALDSFYCPEFENDKKLLSYYVFGFDNEELFIKLIYSQYDDYYNKEATVALKDYGKTWALTKEELNGTEI